MPERNEHSDQKPQYVRIERNKFEDIVKMQAEPLIKKRVASALAAQKKKYDEEKEKIYEKNKDLFDQRMLWGSSGPNAGYKIKEIEAEQSNEDWLITYSDVITLILTLFVLLLSMATIDQAKFEQFKKSLNEEVFNNEEDKTAFLSLIEDFKHLFNRYNMQNAVTVNTVPRGLQLELSSSMLYNSGSATIKTEMEPVLDELAVMLKDFTYDDFVVEIEGHTDNNPINTMQFPSNWELSTNRATNIVKYLITKGIDPEKLRAAGYADTRPKVVNNDEQGNPIPENQAVNRRVVIYVVRDDALL